MNEQLEVLESEKFGIEKAKALEITQGLTQIVNERKVLESIYSETIKLEINQENLVKFKELRLKIRDNRTKGVEVWRVANKEFSLRMGQFIDAIAKKESIENERMESNLLENEKFFEKQEADRVNKLKEERILECTPFAEFVPFGVDLGLLSEESYNNILNGAKLQLKAKLEAEEKAETERLETERLAEEKRIAEAKEERERIEAQRIENERLKIEAEKREKEIQVEREKVRLENEARDKKLREEENERQRLVKIEADKQAKIQAERDAEIKAERDARIKLENEKKAEIEAKQKADLQAKLEAEKLAKAPIKKQLENWVESFTYGLKPIENETSNLIELKFESFKKWAKSEIEKL